VLNDMRKILADGWQKSVPPINSRVSNLVALKTHSSKISNETTDPSVSLNKLSISDTKLSLFPNPSTGNFTVTYYCKDPEQIQLKIYDMKGRLLFNKTDIAVKGINTFHLNLSNFTAGIYYCELVNDIVRNRKKFVIIR
jgi:hypothetical protein